MENNIVEIWERIKDAREELRDAKHWREVERVEQMLEQLLEDIEI